VSVPVPAPRPAMRAEELFVFVGAGVSLSPPGCLPLFPWLRNEVLEQLELHPYVPGGSHRPSSEQQQVAAGLAPEPFMLALERGGADIVPWLRAVLGRGTPNAAHAVLARLAVAGARVWTVNFDTLIERAGPPWLTVCAWPDQPSGGEHLLKPHGTLPGQLIVTSEQVLRGLDPAWERQVRADVAGRTVVFVGYSGRDLDFQPLWDDILQRAAGVLWFDLPDPGEQARKATMLRQVAAAGRLVFPQRPPAAWSGEANPAWDFVMWCGERGLVDLGDDPGNDLVARMHDKVPDLAYPRLQGSIPYARAATQQILGDIAAARRTYAGLLLAGPQRRRAAGDLVNLTLNHGGRLVGAALGAGRLVPPVGRVRKLRAVAHRKRTSILSNLGRHQAVLRETAKLTPDDVSTLLILRASALRMIGSLDEAAAVAEAAMRKAVRERHPNRAANAAFQRGLALIWAYRLDEAEQHLHDLQRPYAQLAATRWVAWADFVEAVLAIHRRRPEPAVRALDAGAARFRAEALLDGQISMETVRLTALRLVGDDDAFQQHRRTLESLLDPANRRGTYYARGHRFTREAVTLEDAEFSRVHRGDLDAAEAGYRHVAGSAYPVHAALGNLGLATVQVQRGAFPSQAEVAASLGRRIEARLVVATAERLLAPPGDRPVVPDELFIP
jgi:hypothetical protein